MGTGVALLEKILQRELHNSRIPRCGDFPEKVAVQIEGGIHHDEVVENVERLRAKFHLLHFTHQECSAERKIELPQPRTFNITHAAVAERSEGRLCERSRIEKVPRRPIAVWISQNLVDALSIQYSATADTRSRPLDKITSQRSVQACDDSHCLTAENLQDRRKAPIERSE